MVVAEGPQTFFKKLLWTGVWYTEIKEDLYAVKIKWLGKNIACWLCVQDRGAQPVKTTKPGNLGFRCDYVTSHFCLFNKGNRKHTISALPALSTVISHPKYLSRVASAISCNFQNGGLVIRRWKWGTVLIKLEYDLSFLWERMCSGNWTWLYLWYKVKGQEENTLWISCVLLREWKQPSWAYFISTKKETPCR